MSRRVSLSMVIALATAWAAGWMVLGLWLIVASPAMLHSGMGSVSIPAALRWSGGFTAICAGQLVFLLLVADRVFPRASRRVVWPVELTVSAGLFVGLAVLLAQFGLIYLG